MEWRRFALRPFDHFAEHLGGRCLIETDLRIDRADRFEQTRDTERVALAGIDRLLE